MSSASNCKCVQTKGRRLGRHGRSADVVGRGVLEDAVGDAGPVEAGDNGKPTGDGRRLEPADVLHPPQVQLEVVSLRVEMGELPLLTPSEEHPQIGLLVLPRGAR
jgi:hypothetical protein